MAQVYKAKFTPSEIYADGRWITDPTEIAAIMAEDAAEADAHRAAKGHDCWDNPVHSTPRGRDTYHCGICGDLLQVG